MAHATARRVSSPTPASAPTIHHGNTLWRRTRSALANAFFQSLAAVGALAPAARPSRHGVEVERDLAYGTTHPSWQKLDLYRPVTRPKPWPVVFYVHGGAFHLLSKDTHWLMGLVFARFGYLCVNISYRLAPEHPFPAAIEDTCEAYRWLAKHIVELGGDPTRVAIAGESAGANLITALAIAATQPRPEPWARATYDTGLRPRAALPFCGLLEASNPERFSERRRLPRWIDGMIRDASTSYLHGHPTSPTEATALADPLRLIEDAARIASAGGVASAGVASAGGVASTELPPFFVPVGTRDPLLDDTRRLEKALGTLNVPCEARYYPGGIHAFHAMVWDPAARRCWRDALAFLDRSMRLR